LTDNSDVRRSHTDARTSTQPVTQNEQLTRAVDENVASRSSAKQKSDRRQSSASGRERPKDVTFTDADSPFHLWYRVPVRIGDEHESAGHYLVTKSLGTESLL